MNQGILTVDRRMMDIVQLVKTVAQSKATILIQGESGTGKEVIASLIHEHSLRKQKAFIAINCAAIPENLLESELFGYEKGSFTGAINSKSGKFELAHGGTLLLDEISEMDIRLQAKLLRVIQEGEVDRIGGRRPIPVDVRIIATTNRNLADCVRGGSFREDLFYRLNVVNLNLPSLRERVGDIQLLSQNFIKKYAERNQTSVSEISPDSLQLLESHSWPGNVRELENVIERALIVSQGQMIQPSHIQIQRQIQWPEDSSQNLMKTDQNSNKSWAPGRTLDDVERNVILEALQHHQGNRTHTAKALGISIRTLRNKLADYRRIGIHA